MTESQIELAVCREAKRMGALVFKFVSPSQTGVPDRMFISEGKVLFIEFKATGKKVRKLQEHRITQLRDEGMRVHVVDDKDEGINLLRSWMAEYGG